MRSKTYLAVLLLATGAPVINAQTLYCPNSLSDTDGDGWGWENNSSCRVLSAPADIPICDSPATDNDNDGWGWNGFESCLIDDVLQGMIVTGGRLIASNSNRPLIEQFTSEELITLRVVDSKGARYEFSHITNNLLFRDKSGDIIWQDNIGSRNSIDSMHLGLEERTPYLSMAAGEVASYDTKGGLNWITDSFELTYNFALTDKSIIFARRGWGSGSGDPGLDYTSVVSLNYDGKINCEFIPDDYLGDVYVGLDQNVYITVGDFGTLYVLKAQ